MFIIFSITFCLVFSLKCKSVSIDKRDSEEVPNIPRALIERLTNFTVEYDLSILESIVINKGIYVSVSISTM